MLARVAVAAREEKHREDRQPRHAHAATLARYNAGVERLLRLVVAIAIANTARQASAHQTSVKYIDLSLADTRVDVTLRFAPGDVTEPLHLPADAQPPMADVLANPAVAPYVQHWLAIVGCPTVTAPVLAKADDKFVAATWSATCAEASRSVTLDFAGFFALDKRHEAIVRLTAPDAKPIQTIVRAGDSPVTLRAGHSPSLLAWVKTGMDHIFEGTDHILFVISLLLVVMLWRSSDWHLRGYVLTLRSTAVVITAFTIAHSISLIAAALGYVQLPGRFVECMIALSIAYTAIEDIVKPDVRWRFLLTFGFGLVHGLGFASTLAELLPPSDVIVPLLCFNIGVEVGQLTIVLVALPLLYVVAKLFGAARYRRVVLPVLASAIALVALQMFAERI